MGEWLPEPIVTDGRDDPARHAETADALSLAMLVVLERLSPDQRAVLLLHDVFDYGYPEIAAIIGKSEDNARQLATRARRHVQQTRPRFQTTREQQDELTRRFFAAAEHGDLAALETLLAHDVELTGDGGGKVPALARALRGRSRVARTLVKAVGLLVACRACRCAPSRSTAARARSSSTRSSGSSACARSRSSAMRSPPSAGSSTPTSSCTSGRSATSQRCCGPRDES